MGNRHVMRHTCMPCASLKRCERGSPTTLRYPLLYSMGLSATFLPLSTSPRRSPRSLLLFFSPRSFLLDPFFTLALERYFCIPRIYCLLAGISLRNSWVDHHAHAVSGELGSHSGE